MSLPSVSQIKTLLEPLVCTWGYPIVFGGTVLENSIILGLIVPGVWIALVAGYYARVGCLNLEMVIVLSTLGALVGDHIDYWLGRTQIQWIRRFSLLKRYIEKVEPLVKQYGGKMVFIGRFSAYLRSWVALSAGALGLPYRQFLLYDVPSAVVWSIAWVTAGYLLGQNELYLRRFFAGTEILFWVAVVLIVGFYLYRRRAEMYALWGLLTTWVRKR